jgi:two-component system, cell cycle sensor histidine kinase and response regulator CckA
MPNTTTILVVDDEELIRKVVSTVLSDVGYAEVLEAEDASQALDIVDTHERPIDLLLSDIVMPGELSGRDLARKVADARPETKILLMSGYELHGGHELQQGWHFIRKPFQKTALIQLVQQALGEPTMMEPAD